MVGGISLYFWLAFTSWLVTLYIFSCAYLPFLYLILKCLCKSFGHLLMLDLLWLSFRNFPYALDIIFLIRYIIYKYFLPLHGLLFPSVDRFYEWKIFLNFHEVSCSFFLILSVHFVLYPRNNGQIHYCKSVLLCLLLRDIFL